MTKPTKKIVSRYARMWPREVFDVMKEGKLLIKELEDLANPGVYILYRDDHPHYVGKMPGRLFSRPSRPREQIQR